MRVFVVVRISSIFIIGLLAAAANAVEIHLPDKPGAVRFAILGDAGTGGKRQHQVGAKLAEVHASYPFEFALMLGDNLYGRERPKDYVRKFERPYKPLLEAGVRFYAVLGNHDEPEQIHYGPFNMDGRFYYSFRKGDVQFFGLNTEDMNHQQLEWLERELRDSAAAWKIAFFHNPIYSSGRRHGSDLELRRSLEPLFVKYGVNAVFSGHDHFYERINPQQGIHYFISGAAGKVRRGNIRRSELTASGYDADNSFMLVEIAGTEMHFQSISRLGETVDRGTIARAERAVAAGAGR